jgi:outer membrane protein OmpA-like peptidoglycan-associated protein
MYFPLQYPRPYTSAIVFFTFPRYSTAFNPGSEVVAAVLMQSAKTADRINISGHTDAQVAGPRDAKIALGRTLAARNFLVNNEVLAEKINVFSQADGRFIAPNITKGRALNRRVEIEFFGLH